VEKLSGEQVSTSDVLEYVCQVVSEFALERILKSPDFGVVDAGTRCHLLWRWTHNNAKVPFSDARKLALASGTDIMEFRDGAGSVRKEKEFVKVLNSQDRARDEAFIRKRSSRLSWMPCIVLFSTGRKGGKATWPSSLMNLATDGRKGFWQPAQVNSLR